MVRVLVVAAILVATAPGSARGEEFAESVQKAAAAVSGGAKVMVYDAKYPETDVQIFGFYIGKGNSMLRYTVDLRAHLCFVQPILGGSPIALTPVACSAIKKGYPLVAPLITWND